MVKLLRMNRRGLQCAERTAEGTRGAHTHEDGGGVVPSRFSHGERKGCRRKTQVAVANFAIKSSQRDTSHIMGFEIRID